MPGPAAQPVHHQHPHPDQAGTSGLEPGRPVLAGTLSVQNDPTDKRVNTVYGSAFLFSICFYKTSFRRCIFKVFVSLPCVFISTDVLIKRGKASAALLISAPTQAL